MRWCVCVWWCLVLASASAAAEPSPSAGMSLQALLVQQFVRSKMADVAHLLENSTCGFGLLQMARGLLRTEPWAIRMVDASSKMSSGYLEGNIVNLGNWDECIGVRVPAYSSLGAERPAKYCLLGLDVLEVLGPYLPKEVDEYKLFLDMTGSIYGDGNVETLFAACVPEECEAEELMRLADKFLHMTGVKLRASDRLCQTAEVRYDFKITDWLAILLFAGVGVLMVLSTAYDVFLERRKQKPFHKVLLIFSVYTNLRQLLTVRRNRDQIACINGIRFISIMWVILGHRHLIRGMFPNTNYLYIVQTWLKQVSTGFVLGAMLSVDTFFLISGVLVVYVVLLAKQQGIRFNIVHFYLHRYFRLTPALAVLVLVYSTVLRFLSRGPLWPMVYAAVGVNCDRDWWQPLLYIQNVGPGEVCVAHSWYLAVDTQLYLLAPLLYLGLSRWPKLSTLLATILMLLSTFYGFWVSWDKRITAQNINHFHDFYMSTPVRGCVWIIGGLLGYTLFRTRDRKIRINRFLNVALWTVTLAGMLLVVISKSHFFRYKYDRVVDSLYNGFARDLWALCIAWIVFACYHGYGGYINSALSCGPFMVLGRLTYPMYLVHVLVITVTAGAQTQPSEFTDLNMFTGFWGDLVDIVIVALFWSLAFESPAIALGKILLPASIKKSLKQAQNGGTADGRENGGDATEMAVHVS